MIRSPLRRNTGEARASVKVSRCKAPGCRNPAIPYRKHCGPECGAILGLLALEKAKRVEAKRERLDDGIKREELKTLPQLLREAQIAFNHFIRLRDAGRPCICCGKAMPASEASGVGGSVDCGHYRSVGSAQHLRFDERNAHAQSKVCNRWGAGRAVDYRIGLVGRLGLATVEALEADNATHKWTRDEVRAIRDQYRAKVRELKKEQA